MQSKYQIIFKHKTNEFPSSRKEHRNTGSEMLIDQVTSDITSDKGSVNQQCMNNIAIKTTDAENERLSKIKFTV